jgi:hypothetical protein
MKPLQSHILILNYSNNFILFFSHQILLIINLILKIKIKSILYFYFALSSKQFSINHNYSIN